MQVSALYFVGRGVALGDEPDAARQVQPPFLLDAGRAVAVEHVIRPIGVRTAARIRHRPDFAGILEFRHRSQAVDWAAQQLHGGSKSIAAKTPRAPRKSETELDGSQRNRACFMVRVSLALLAPWRQIAYQCPTDAAPFSPVNS